MVQTIFLKVISLSLTASIAAFVLIVLRPFLKKIPAWIRCVLWGLVGIRLACPIAIQSSISLVPDFEKTLGSSGVSNTLLSTAAVDNTGGLGPASEIVAGGSAAVHTIPFMQLAAVIWLTGIFVMVLVLLISAVKMQKTIGPSIHYGENIYICDDIASPFVKGIINPKIYMPSGLDEETIRMALMHENSHIKRKDNLFKAIGYSILIIHWFNPIIWAAYFLFGRDIECACDEKTVREMDYEERAGYSDAILRCSSKMRLKTVGYAGFAADAVKSRIGHVLGYRRPSKKIISLSIIFAVMFYLLFMTSQATHTIDLSERINGHGGENMHVMEVSSQNGAGDEERVQKYFYDSEGTLEKQIETDASGNVISYREYEKDSNGWISEINEFDKDGNPVSRAEYTRDRNGKELSCKAYYMDNSFCWWNEFEYDENGNPYYYVRYNEDGSVLCSWESSFDASGMETERVCHDSNGVELWKQLFKYDSEGNIKYTEQYDSEGNMNSHMDYTFL